MSAEAERFDERALGRWLMREGGWLIALATASFLFLVLFSYHPEDPGIDRVDDTLLVHNYGGRTGAWIASVLLYVFGVWAFLIPFLLLAVAWRTFRMTAHRDERLDRLARGGVGMLLLMLGGGALSSLFLDPEHFMVRLPHAGGGVIGYALGRFLVDSVDLLATTLFLLTLVALSISLITGLTWLEIFEQTGRVIWWGIRWLIRLKGRALSNPKKRAVSGEGAKLMTEHKARRGEPTLVERLKPAVIRKRSKKKNKSEPPARTQAASAHDGRASDREAQESEAALPSAALLDAPPEHMDRYDEAQLAEMSQLLERNLRDFGVKATVESVQPGPVVTRFEILPAPGVKVSQISNLAKDLARALSVRSVRVVEVIPGKSTVGIEVPNLKRQMIVLREIISSDLFVQARSPLTLALGKDIAGEPVVADLAKMPHLLVAGTTGSGKSVGINSMILSILYKATPEQVRLIMVDPKMLELSVYEDIPHLLTPVVTDMNEAASALRWCVYEMDRRYRLMAKLGVRNIAGFNEKVQAAIDKGEPLIDPLWQPDPSYGHELSEQAPMLEPLPFIVVIIDEFADMMMVVGKKVEELIARLAQKARAAGIHLIIATQRPSVNVITGLIKANIPTRISFQVSSKTDSRTILDQSGAEHLLGQGDMLYKPPGDSSLKRVHGAFVSDEEVHRVVEHVKRQGAPRYLDMQLQQGDEGVPGQAIEGGGDAEQDSLYDAAVAFVIEKQRVSVSMIQRQFSIGYNRAARIVEAMEKAGVVSEMESNGSRKVLVPKER